MARRVDIRWLHAQIRPQHDHDAILAMAIDQDRRNASGDFVVLRHVIMVNAFGIPNLVGKLGEDILAQPPDESNIRAQPRRRDCLVAAFAARASDEALAMHCLA